MNGYNFTERVRRALANARAEAGRLHHEYVGTEHILVGLVSDNEGVAATVLDGLSIDRLQVRQKIDETVKRGGAEYEYRDDLPYTSRAKKVLELAMAEARDLGHSYVGTEHLLLGLLREEKGIAAQVLTYLGLTLEAARAEVVRQVGAPTGMDAGVPPTRSDWQVGPAQAASVARQRAFVAFWMTLGIVVLVESARPLLHAISGSEPVSRNVVALASVEIIGALLFLFPRTLKYGAWILLAVFTIAIVAHLARGELAAPLLVYAAGAFFVLIQRTGGRRRTTPSTAD